MSRGGEYGTSHLSTSAPVSNAYPPFSVFLYGGMTQEDEHVTVWEPSSGKTVAGNAAPYRKNLRGWLAAHPGWEEKADELKSSKRRSAARRQKAISSAFASLCVHGGELPHAIMSDSTFWLRASGASEGPSSDSEWTSDEDSRLKEALVHLAEDLYFAQGDPSYNSELQWKRIGSSFVPRWNEVDVMRRARDLLKKGLLSYVSDHRGFNTPLATSYGSPLDSNAIHSFSPVSSPFSYFDRQLVAPREPRITVWEPATGRTVSGNAAPCRRNLDAWIRAHPGWEVKSEEQLSSSRRVKSKRPSSAISEGRLKQLSTSVPQFPDARDIAESLILLSRSPIPGSVPTVSVDADEKMETSSTTSDLDNMDVEEEESDEEEQTSMRERIRSSPVEIPNTE